VLISDGLTLLKRSSDLGVHGIVGVLLFSMPAVEGKAGGDPPKTPNMEWVSEPAPWEVSQT